MAFLGVGVLEDTGDGDAAYACAEACPATYASAWTTHAETAPNRVADANGDLDYHRTIPASDILDGVVENIENLQTVQHGLDANGTTSTTDAGRSG